LPDAWWDPVVTMDDATGEQLSMFFCEEEGIMSSFHGVGQTIARHGLSCSFYTDRGSHYFTTPEAGGKVDKRNPTRFGRACPVWLGLQRSRSATVGHEADDIVSDMTKQASQIINGGATPSHSQRGRPCRMWANAYVRLILSSASVDEQIKVGACSLICPSRSPRASRHSSALRLSLRTFAARSC
jgi:hypothetical protein